MALELRTTRARSTLDIDVRVMAAVAAAYHRAG
jgi:hypothetical protein